METSASPATATATAAASSASAQKTPAPSSSSSSSTKEAFEFFPDDAQSIFQQFLPQSNSLHNDHHNIATVESITKAYNINREHSLKAIKDPTNMTNAVKKFHEELLDNKDPKTQSTLTEQQFVSGIEKANQLLLSQPEYKREEIMKEMERLCLEMANNDPKFFMDMLDLPGALMLEDVKALMALIK